MKQFRWNRQWISAGAPGVTLAVLAVSLAAFGVPGVSQSVALASASSPLNWVEQAPATSPPARTEASMAYDAATGDVVLFGGLHKRHALGGTWLWNGSTWAKQASATYPDDRFYASMAYDAATGDVVLFGGDGRAGLLHGTWVWGSQ